LERFPQILRAFVSDRSPVEHQEHLRWLRAGIRCTDPD